MAKKDPFVNTFAIIDNFFCVFSSFLYVFFLFAPFMTNFHVFSHTTRIHSYERGEDMTKYVAFFTIICICLFSIPAQAESKHRVALVIDDFGNNMKGTEDMLALPIPLTVAVMPFLSTTKADAILAHKKGKEVIVHLPMEPMSGKQSWLGPKPITTDLSDAEIKARVKAAIKSVPYATGMNNHMGSKATADERVMRIVLQQCKEHNLFFLDSKTNHKSVVSKIAKELGVPCLENEVFLDQVASYSHVSKRMELLVTRLQTDAALIAIGHVGIHGDVTSSVIKQYIPRLQANAELQLASEMLPK
jgi:uncharacterized protein